MLSINDPMVKGNISGNSYPEAVRNLPSGYVAASPADIMRFQVEAHSSDNWKVRSDWLSKMYDTSSAILTRGDVIKIEYKSPLLQSLPPQAGKLSALPITNEQFDSSRGIELSWESIFSTYNCTHLTKDQAKNHPLWRVAAENDEYLISSFFDAMFSELQPKSGLYEGLSVWMPQQRNQPLVRAVNIGGFTTQRAELNLQKPLYSKSELVGIPYAQSNPPKSKHSLEGTLLH